MDLNNVHMKNFGSLLLLITIVFSTLSFTGYQGPGNLLHWQADYQLQFSDFQGAPKPDRGSCSSHCTLGMDNKFDKDAQKNVLIEVSVHNIFTKNKSWIKKGDQKMLHHERGHFDLSEVYARKLRKKIREEHLTYGNYRGVLHRLHQQTLKELDARRNKYSAETMIGNNEKAQEKWQQAIQQELRELSDFRKGKVTKPIGS